MNAKADTRQAIAPVNWSKNNDPQIIEPLP